MTEKPVYCDDCGDKLINNKGVTITHCPFHTQSTLEGESAQLHGSCFKRLFNVWAESIGFPRLSKIKWGYILEI